MAKQSLTIPAVSQSAREILGPIIELIGRLVIVTTTYKDGRPCVKEGHIMAVYGDTDNEWTVQIRIWNGMATQDTVLKLGIHDPSWKLRFPPKSSPLVTVTNGSSRNQEK